MIMRANKQLFYFLSFTWGIIMTSVGIVVALCLVVTKHKPKKHGWCYYFEVGKKGWGGVNLGIVFLTEPNPSAHTKNHEHGHALQNCIWGPLMPFVISLPSAARYHMRKFKRKRGEKLGEYDSAWFEGQASVWGDKFMSGFGGESDGNN